MCPGGVTGGRHLKSRATPRILSGVAGLRRWGGAGRGSSGTTAFHRCLRLHAARTPSPVALDCAVPAMTSPLRVPLVVLFVCIVLLAPGSCSRLSPPVQLQPAARPRRPPRFSVPPGLHPHPSSRATAEQLQSSLWQQTQFLAAEDGRLRAEVRPLRACPFDSFGAPAPSLSVLTIVLCSCRRTALTPESFT